MDQQHPLVWSAPYAMYLHDLDQDTLDWYFLTQQDLVQAQILGYNCPEDVTTAYFVGNTKDTTGINLVRVGAGDEGVLSGNVHYISVMNGTAQAKFPPTAAIAQSYRIDGEGAVGTQDIPLIKLHKSVSGTPPPVLTTYIENRAHGGRISQDYTSFHAGQAHWTESNPPAVTAIIETFSGHQTHPPTVKDAVGNDVMGQNGRLLYNLSHILPDRISTHVVEDGYLLASWFAAEPRLQPFDIIDRMYRPITGKEAKNLANNIRQNARRWRVKNHMLSAAEQTNGKGDRKTDMEAIEGLTCGQIERNTSWELDVTNRYIKRPGTQAPNEEWYPAPELHHTSPLRSGPPLLDLVTPRIRKALHAIEATSQAPSLPANGTPTYPGCSNSGNSP